MRRPLRRRTPRGSRDDENVRAVSAARTRGDRARRRFGLAALGARRPAHLRSPGRAGPTHRGLRRVRRGGTGTRGGEAALAAVAKSETDTAGNLWVKVGQGNPLVVFVAHLDEIGFRVSAIRDDGSLELETRGGFFTSLFEAEPALVHTAQGDVPGIFLPRDSGFVRRTPPPLRVDLGTATRAAA